MSQITAGCIRAAKEAMDKGEAVDESIFNNTIDSLNRRYSIMEKVGENLVDMFPDKGYYDSMFWGTIVGMMLR